MLLAVTGAHLPAQSPGASDRASLNAAPRQAMPRDDSPWAALFTAERDYAVAARDDAHRAAMLRATDRTVVFAPLARPAHTLTADDFWPRAVRRFEADGAELSAAGDLALTTGLLERQTRTGRARLRYTAVWERTANGSFALWAEGLDVGPGAGTDGRTLLRLPPPARTTDVTDAAAALRLADERAGRRPMDVIVSRLGDAGATRGELRAPDEHVRPYLGWWRRTAEGEWAISMIWVGDAVPVAGR